MAERSPARRRVGLVLSGGGARGAYEAGVLAHLFEEIYPRLPPGFEFDVLSGTSVGAIHAAYVAASAHLAPAPRAGRLADTWRDMRVNDVLQLSFGDLFRVPLRALGVTSLARRLRSSTAASRASWWSSAARTPAPRATRSWRCSASEDRTRNPSRERCAGGL